MQIEPPANPNYAATVVRVKTLVPLPKADNLLGIPMFGMQAIVGKDTQVGDLGVLFPAECQLSDAYTKANNLYHHTELNADPEKPKGYIEDNRRVKAIRLRGNRSDALFMPMTSVALAVGIDTTDYKQVDDFLRSIHEGDTFDRLNGIDICCKYQRKMNPARGLPGAQRRKARVEEKAFPEQFNIVNFFRVEDSVDPMAQVVLTQKLHGTSIRVGNVPVSRKLSLLERIARRLGVKVRETEFAMVYGSHHVIKDANNPEQQHFYDEDIWTTEGKRLDGLVPENYVVYAELIGWTAAGAPIQRNYTYNQLPGTCRLYVYRVAMVNGQGVSCDLSWPAVKEFCQSIGVPYVPELTHTEAIRLTEILPMFLDNKFGEIRWLRESPVPLAAESPCDEGVCIRIEGGTPAIFKAKSPLFLQHETKMLDAAAEDLEAEEAVSA